MAGNLIWRLFLALAVALIIRSSYSVVLDIVAVNQSSSWPSTQGTVVKYTDFNAALRSWRRDQIVEYEFHVQGVRYTGNQITFSKRSKWDYEDVKTATAKWPSNPEVSVYYDSANPMRSVLEPGGSNVANILFFVAQLLAALGLSALLIFHLRQDRLNPSPIDVTNPPSGTKDARH
ncbi:DUF3592 domain-containing protein [Prosthecobacter sp.]